MESFRYTSRTFYGKEVLFRSYSGVLTAELEIHMLKYAVENGLINKNVKGMALDMIHAQFNMEIGDGNKIIDYVASDPVLAPLKYAIIVNTPEKIIFPLLGGIHNAEARIKPFSTEQAAIQWILL